MKKFEPEKTYEGLKKQAYALDRLVTLNEERINLRLSQQAKEHYKELQLHRDLIDSEKTINDKLTRELEEKENHIKDLEEIIHNVKRKHIEYLASLGCKL